MAIHHLILCWWWCATKATQEQSATSNWQQATTTWTWNFSVVVLVKVVGRSDDTTMQNLRKSRVRKAKTIITLKIVDSVIRMSHWKWLLGWFYTTVANRETLVGYISRLSFSLQITDCICWLQETEELVWNLQSQTINKVYHITSNLLKYQTTHEQDCLPALGQREHIIWIYPPMLVHRY